jgi:hypothetical protein
MGGATGNASGGNWTANSNGILITAGAQTATSSALYVGHQSNISYITSLAPGVAWRNIEMYANIYYLHTQGGLNVYLDPGTAGWITVSDEKEKEDIQDLKTSTSLKRVLALKPKHYRRKYYDNETPVSDEVRQMRQVGFLAHEVQKTNPHCVSKWCNDKAIKKRDEAKVKINVPEGEDEDVKVEINIEEEEDDGIRLGLNYNDYTIHLVGAVQEQQRMIEMLTQRNQTLEDRLAKLEQLLEKNGLM